MGARLERPARAGHARLRVDDHALTLDRISRSARGRAARRSRSSPGSRSGARSGGVSSGSPYGPGRELRGPRVLEPVPGRVDGRIGEAMALRRDRRRRPASAASSAAASSCGRQTNSEVGAARERCLVRDEPRNAAPPVAAEPRVERVGRLPGERVGAERVELERRGAGARDRASPDPRTRMRRRSRRSPSAYYADTIGVMPASGATQGFSAQLGATLRARWSASSSSMRATSP